ncbi:AzlC family ABC transporter permease [Streptomyces sp. JJ66]|uniref:AzlC family ABC transporter permease n=1 Tax=Streptomyces sp. JJ66 TaxID=2803843 RepID=UPI001C59891D|nr:AzlC family ABC transporter permease [Streptomyces sp. JJ66]MBW1603890.1 AzlC family ABC transporter permease [Streptomyces sp. JJ66]
MVFQEQDQLPRKEKTRLVRDAVGVGLAVGAYGLSYGALAVSSGLTLAQTQFLSLALYGGSAQLALIGTLAAGGGGLAASATATLLGVRSLFYGVSLRPVLRPRGAALLPAAHLLSDESTAMAIAKPTLRERRFAYWATGAVVFLFWNLTTLIGALSGSLLTDPEALGLDAASSAAFLALVAPRLRERAGQFVFVLAALVAIAVSPVLGSGLPVVLAGLTALSVLLLPATASAAARGGAS